MLRSMYLRLCHHCPFFRIEVSKDVHRCLGLCVCPRRQDNSMLTSAGPEAQSLFLYPGSITNDLILKKLLNSSEPQVPH